MIKPMLGVAFSLLLAVEAHAAGLVLYTSQPQTDAQQTVDAFRKARPDIEVTTVRDGTPRIMAKLRAEFEAGQPQPDVLLIADSVTMESLKRDGRLLPIEPPSAAAYPKGLHDPDGTWFATKLITTGIVYNTKAPFVPKRWADLVRPEAKGLVTLPSPLASGAAMIHTVTLTHSLPQGWGYYEALQANGALASGGNGDVLKQVAGGEKLYGMIVDFMPIRERAKGAPVAFVFPEDGVSAVTEPVAVLKTARNPEAAQAFVEFLLSRDGQELASRMGYVPASPDVALPAGYPERASIRVLPFDAGKALADDAANKKRFADVFGQ